MEALGLYLLKSAVWLTGFTLVFLVVLRNERYFRLNRIYLLSGIVAAIVFPFYTWHYAVILPSVQVAFTTTSDFSAVATVVPVSTPIPFYWWLYLVGMISIAIRLVWQTGMVVRKLRKTGYVKTGSVKLVRTSEYAASFSFFSFVFVNPSTSDIETKEIVNHEREHIQQKHWFDLLLVELLCMLQWFNPFIWIYARLIRQNHEYLADEMALQHTSNPAIYQATLLNQMFGAPVISLANSFNYSLNKKRFKMMKKKIDSPFRKLKVLLVLPLVAMVFYAFAKPEYVSTTAAFPTDKVNVSADGNDVKGKVVNPDGNPIERTTVIIKGTTIGAMTDKDGNFRFNDVPKDAELIFSFVGFQTARVKPDFKKTMTIQMVPAAVGINKVVVVGYGNDKIPPPPPPPPPPTKIKIDSIDLKNPPLYILDGMIIDPANMNVKPENIDHIDVLKDKSAIELYGKKAKNGVVLIYSKEKTGAAIDRESAKKEQINHGEQDQKNKPVFIVVEEMPEFPGGINELRQFIVKKIKYPVEARKINAQGTVIVNFIVNSNGKVERAKVVRGVHPALDAEAIRVVNSMPDWKPGKQRGTAVDVVYTMPIEFMLQ